MTKIDYLLKIDEVNRLLNDPTIAMDPARIWSLMADIAKLSEPLAPEDRGETVGKVGLSGGELVHGSRSLSSNHERPPINAAPDRTLGLLSAANADPDNPRSSSIAAATSRRPAC
jgi:hypothetical protein